MRQIKFRGLNTAGNWVYGLLSSDAPNSTQYYKEYSCRICWHPESGGYANQPVRNGTVGQFTGLRDCEGLEIYEGDRLKDHNGIGVVEYVEMYAAFRVNYANGQCKWFYDYTLPRERESIEIIGNIHQYPELRG